jgi:hypothetical protein
VKTSELKHESSIEVASSVEGNDTMILVGDAVGDVVLWKKKKKKKKKKRTVVSTNLPLFVFEHSVGGKQLTALYSRGKK